LTLTPHGIVAPVGSEVVLLATVSDGQSQPMPGQRVEWMLSPDSAGQLMTLDRRSRILTPHRNRPKKVDNSYAIANTTSQMTTLTRGTPTQVDDVAVQPGQAWISVSSATGGASYVTAFAPNIATWDRRKQTTIIYWVDAQFSFPAPAIGPVGSRQIFTTVVSRSSDGSPIEGYRVRYTITGGLPAAFAPGGVSEIEVATDADGRASVEVFQPQPARGESTIQIEIARPPGFAGSGDRRLVVGRGATMMSWTAPEIAVSIAGPAQAQVGATATYRIEATNTGDGPVSELVLTNRTPTGLSYQSSSVPADSSPSGLEWRLGELGPGQVQSIDVNYEVTREGVIRNCVVANTAEGVTAEDCATTNTSRPSLDIRVTGPETARLGEDVTFAITITNRNNTDITGLIIKDTYDAGLQHEVNKNPIERDLGTLAAGSTRDDLAVTFRVTQVGRLCHTVEVRGNGIQPTSAIACVNVIGESGPPAEQPPTEQPPTEQPPAEQPSLGPEGQPGLRVDKQGPQRARVGDTIRFDLTVTNTGETDLTNVKVVDTYDRGLEPSRVSEGWIIEDEKLTWRFDRMRPGEIRQLQVEVECTEALRACSNAVVSADSGLTLADEACVQIDPAEPPVDDAGPPPEGPQLQPAPGHGATEPSTPEEETSGPGLVLNITDLRDEVPVGRTVTYEVTVTNPRNVSDRNVELVVNVPTGMTPVATGTVAPSKHTITGRTVRFNPVAEIRPGESLIFRVPIRADRAGRFTVEAKAISNTQRSALYATEETNIYSEGSRRRLRGHPQKRS
jgi:uncharacterized repeat protein (TIGR01451 family)